MTPIAGENVKVDIDNLIPNSPIHGLLGPIAVFNGNTDSTGGGTIDFPIPKNTTKGIHLITSGVDGTAFTADCVVNIV